MRGRKMSNAPRPKQGPSCFASGVGAVASLAAAAALLTGCGTTGEETALPPQHPKDAGQDVAAADAKKDGNGSCVPLTCGAIGAECGSTPDGCGSVLECGSCKPNVVCGGGGPNQCGSTPCTPKTCAGLPNACGVMSDGCAETIDCGSCTAPKTCGGGGVANTCGCAAPSCASLGASCGTPSDACGNTVSCGTCTAPQTCGGGGQPYKCGCKPQGCGNKCGSVGDGCGGTLSCSCSGGKQCIGGTCCAPSCSGASCGDSDGCGGACDGDCPWSQTCGSDHQCHCGPSPDFKSVGGQCKASCGQFLSHQGWSNDGGGCCPGFCAAGVQGSSLNETWDCVSCCESVPGFNACQ
ncbi:MAG: hypothetical protein HY898_15705 [Deltaproteobacteria bacterium]|nr:hypothetical protein [Deltaproteobacteria bacterium]